MAARLPLIAGNWKMNLNHLEAIGLVQKIAFSLPEKYFAKVEVAVLPPFVDIRSIQTLVDGDKLLLKYGAQDISQHESGAYTGEVSGAMLKKLACHYVVVGHSERREYHGETDAIINAKVKAALKHEVTPIFCFGEKLDVREAKGHLELVRQQLEDGLKGFTAEQVAKIVFAYEPVWAIGTGRTASSADAQEVCSLVRSFVAEKYGEETAAVVRVLYGGSVKSSNIGELIAQKDIDGALVGGASLQADEFTKLCALAAGGPLP